MRISRTSGRVITAGSLLLATAACVSPATRSATGGPDADAGFRIYDTRQGGFVTTAQLTEELVGVDVIFFGEFHDDSIAHGVQLRLFDEFTRRTDPGVLGLEMFERDVQQALSRYIRGDDPEEAFLAAARPWSNYRTDYRPLVELAKERGWEVAATNLPQRYATVIAREGIEALDRLGSAERWLAAADIECPEDAYWRRFLTAMFEETDAAPEAPAHLLESPVLRRTYQAQCARDETMAETLVELLDAGPILHLNGAFHTDYRLGIVPRLLRRAPEATVRVISALPVPDLVDPPIAEHLGRADYVVFTREAGAT